MKQTVMPREIIVCIDHNDELLNRCRARWQSGGREDLPDIVVLPNKYDGRLGSARNTAAEVARGHFLAFLDDDARAEPTWLEHLLSAFSDRAVLAVGGTPLPVYESARPRWFPFEFDWVFGCAYVGLPTTAAPIRHVIGATMAVRRADLRAIGGFHSDNHDDMDMCHRLLGRWPSGTIRYEPKAIVHHFVHRERVTWRYFWRRCFFVNKGKVEAVRNMGDAGNLTAERQFVLRALTTGVVTGLRQCAGGDVGGLLRALCICAGVALAGAGYATGSVQYVTRRLLEPCMIHARGRRTV